jgi:hypothetical protein
MTDEVAKERGYQYRASLYGVMGHANLDEDAEETFTPDWRIFDLYIEIMIYIELLKTESMGFPLKLYYEL